MLHSHERTVCVGSKHGHDALALVEFGNMEKGRNLLREEKEWEAKKKVER
jgi:hypothetical protein